MDALTIEGVSRRVFKPFCCALLAGLLLWTADAPAADGWQTSFQFGGCGGVYFLASPGELWVEVEKRDLNRRGATHLRAILVGPDRHVLVEEWLADDGREKGSGPGPVQRVRLETPVLREGVYALNITVTTDRYGMDTAWGFRTNCSRYLVETSRGHRDAPHEEPLVLLTPGVSGDVCFLPQVGEFAVEASGLTAGALTLYDPQGKEAGVLTVSEKGEASGTFRNDTAAAPWRLHFPKFKGVVQIDGVTRWAEGEGGFENLSLWTPHAESWFNFHDNRWLLTPYRCTVYADAGAEGRVVFSVHNNAPGARKVALGLEFPGDRPWSVELPAREVTLGPDEAIEVALRYRVPAEGDTWTCHLRATPVGGTAFSTYSTLELRRGTAPAAEAIPIPHVLRPYNHENERFGYLPDYPLTNEVYFDVNNQPVITSGSAITLRRGNSWHEITSARNSDGEERPFRLAMSKVAFDQANGIYTIAIQDEEPVFLHAPDGATAFRAYRIPGEGRFDIEQFSGHNLSGNPPAFIRNTLTATDPKVFWRRVNDLVLFVPEKTQDGGISIGNPIPLSNKSIGLSSHSGIPSSVVSRGRNVHVAWGEATDPEKKVPGVPTFVATYDRETGGVSEPAFVGYGPPANDVHNSPCITMDSQGYLHVLVGTHGRTFKYARSLEPNNAGGGWTQPENIGPGLRQTYVGLVCDQDDTLHLVFRLWLSDTAYFPASSFGSLAYMSKRPGEPWSEARPLIIAAFSDYSIFYHRLTIDRKGGLFLSYDYWSTYWFYRTDHRGSRRALITSPDQGATWKMGALEDLLR